ncbi:MAG: DUF7343 domain-containing protein [Nitrososphaerales archaeon]
MGKVDRALLDILNEHDGEAYQSELVRMSGFSRSRVSEVLSEMQRNGLLSKFPVGIGKNFNVMLNANLKGRKNNHVKGRRKKNKTIHLGFTRAAEYPFVVPFRRFLKDKLDLDLQLRIYANGIDVTRDLSLHRLDLGISPVLTQFMFYSLGSPIKIIAPAGSGGSSLLVSRKGRGRHANREAEFRIASSKLSTMELLMRSSVNQDVLPRMSRVVYTSSPEEIMKDAASRSVDAACIWEPYATILLAKKKGDFSRVIRYSDMGEHLCCALAAGNHLNGSFLDKVRRIFLESLEEYNVSRDSFTPPYATLTGFDQKTLDLVSREYSYPMELDSNLISHQFERAGLTVPAPFSVKDAVRAAG